jgi:hypothetical protein
VYLLNFFKILISFFFQYLIAYRKFPTARFPIQLPKIYNKMQIISLIMKRWSLEFFFFQIDKFTEIVPRCHFSFPNFCAVEFPLFRSPFYFRLHVQHRLICVISRVCLYILYKVDYIRVIITTNKDEGSEKKFICLCHCLLRYWLSACKIQSICGESTRTTNFCWNVALCYW